MKKIVYIFCLIAVLCGCIPQEELYDYLAEDHCFMYAREHLDERQQQNYDFIYNSIMARKEEVEIISGDEDDAVTTYTALFNDHPELFFVNPVLLQTVKDNGDFHLLHIKYTFTEEETADYNMQLKTKSDEILAGIPAEASDFDKVKYVYDYIIDSTQYVTGAQNNQNLLSVMITNESVCAGYARTMQYLLNQMNIPVSYITGEIVDSPENIFNKRHGWNLVKMDNEYYYVDATYGDQLNGRDDNKTYAFLGMNSDDMLQLYTPDVPYETTQATKNNYFVQTGAYFTQYDPDQLLRLIDVSPVNEITFKCDNNETYQTMKKIMLDEYKMFDLLKRYGIPRENISYEEFPMLNTIHYIF